MLLEKIKNKIHKAKLNRFIQNTPIEKIDSLSGYDFEKYVCSLFESASFSCKTTSKSKDNGVDLLAQKDGITIAIQTKLYYNHKVSNSAIQEVYTGADFLDTNLSLVVTNWYFSTPATAVAQKLNVGLIDRNMLTRIISTTPKNREYLLDNLIYSLYTKKQPRK